MKRLTLFLLACAFSTCLVFPRSAFAFDVGALEAVPPASDSLDHCTENSCVDFRYMYIANNTPGYDQGTVFDGYYSEGTMELTELFSLGFRAHMAIDDENHLLYFVSTNGEELHLYDIGGYSIGSYQLEGLGQVTALAFNPDDQLLYAATQDQRKIFTVDPFSGNTSVFAENLPVQGGDLFFDNNDDLKLIKRSTCSPSMVFRIEEGEAIYEFDIASNINGGGRDQAGGVIAARGAGSTSFFRYDAGGQEIEELTAQVDGSPFQLFDGDMATGCFDPDPLSVAFCYNFRSFYIADNSPGYDQGTVFEIESNGINMQMTELFSTGIGGHLAVNPEELLLYVLDGDGSQVVTYDMDGNLLNTVSLQGLGSTPAVVYDPFSELLFAGSSSQDRIYTIDPVSGETTLYAEGIPVNGGDLIIDSSGQLKLIERVNGEGSKVFIINGGTAELLHQVAPSVNGAALTEEEGILAAQGNSSSFWKYDSQGEEVAELEAIHNGEPFPLVDGDMAAGCFSASPFSEQASCYATALSGQLYQEGTMANGSMLPANRTDPIKALYEPEMDNSENFVSLGYGGSITLKLDQPILDYPGDDLFISETSFGDPSCGAYPEYADVEISMDGSSWCHIATICMDDSIDIGESDLYYVRYVRISNNDELTQTPDGYDLDGIAIINGDCGDALNGIAEQETSTEKAIIEPEEASLKSFPNPSSGWANVSFKLPVDTRVNIDLFSLSGERVMELYSGYSNAGEASTLDFNAANLSEGVYVLRLTTASGVSRSEKLFIDK